MKFIEELKLKLEKTGEAYLSVKVRPQSGSSGIIGCENEVLKVNLRSAPERGRANAELIKLLSREFEVPANNIKIISGAGERSKLVKIIS